jgi:hypothetical protein
LQLLSFFGFDDLLKLLLNAFFEDGQKACTKTSHFGSGQ